MLGCRRSQVNECRLLAGQRRRSAGDCKGEAVSELLQLGVLGLGLLQDGDVGVGFFPEREEIPVLGGVKPHPSWVAESTTL